MTEQNTYATDVHGYSTFQDIDNVMLRAWNQYNVLSNLNEAGLLGVGHSYIEALTKTDRLALYVMVEYIKEKGLENTKREIIYEGVGLAA